VAQAAAKRLAKKCDWLVANDVRPETGIMGGALNQVVIIDGAGQEAWPMMPKEAVAARLALRISAELTRGA
jgi:phosphopantothenoylcysteine decarboxylase/phosphopantothenate--cysteine ligase